MQQEKQPNENGLLTGNLRHYWEQQLIAAEKRYERANRMVMDTSISDEQHLHWEDVLHSSRIAYEQALNTLGWKPHTEIDSKPVHDCRKIGSVAMSANTTIG